MNAIIPQIAEAMQRLFGEEADQLGRETGFIQRQVKLTGSSFIQALVFGFAENPASTYSELSQSTTTAGTPISNQGLEQRFTPPAAHFIQRVLERMVETVILEAHPSRIPLLARFNGVYLRDSTVIMLPSSLQEEWRGNGGQSGANAALKLQVNFNYATGQLQGPVLCDGRSQDHSSPYQSQTLPPGALHLADLGYFSLARFAADERQQVYWISRLKFGTVIADEAGQRIDLLRMLQNRAAPEWEQPILLGARHRLACRLLVQRVPQEVAEQRRRRLREAARIQGQTVSAQRLVLADWTVVVTNVPVAKLALREALLLLGVRWQVELLFKLWKSHQQIDKSIPGALKNPGGSCVSSMPN
jgi:hypothetical protein